MKYSNVLVTALLAASFPAAASPVKLIFSGPVDWVVRGDVDLSAPAEVTLTFDTDAPLYWSEPGRNEYRTGNLKGSAGGLSFESYRVDFIVEDGTGYSSDSAWLVTASVNVSNGDVGWIQFFLNLGPVAPGAGIIPLPIDEYPQKLWFIGFSNAGGHTYNYGGYTFDLEVAAPEPAALALFGLGLAGLGMIRRRRFGECRDAR